MESVADMMQDVEQHFAYRARQEQKEILLSESEDISLLCDRDWLIEAIDNIVKNALDIQQMEIQFALNGKLYPMPFKSL